MRVSLLVCTYNRPIYLKQCLDSLRRSDLSQIEKLLVIDDHSSDKETILLINEFEIEGVDVVKIRKGKNKGIKDSLAIGYLIAFEHSNIVINLDGDAIVRRDFVSVLLGLKEQFPDNIVSGFNTTVKNRNPIIEEHPTYFKKKYASGINMVINKDQYEDYLLPALSMPIGNFDFEASKLHMADGKAVIVSNPSVVQHIGVGVGNSSMGHTSESEPADVAEDFVDDFKEVWDSPNFTVEDMPEYVESVIGIDRYGKKNGKLSLPEVTLIGVDGYNLAGLIKAIDKSCAGIEFGVVKILSHLPSADKRVIKIRPILSKKEYSVFMLKEIVDYIDTPYFITVQADGWIVNPTAWNEDWLNYHYIGSPWEWYTDGLSVGNGAASLRKRELHQILKDDPKIIPTNDSLIRECQEDHNIARIYRTYLERKYDIKFAPIEVARKFGIEAWNVPPPNNKYAGQFVYHGKHVDFSDSIIKP